MRFQVSLHRKYLGLFLLACVLMLGISGCQIGPKQPRARYGAAMVWDAGEDQMILFGGRAKSLVGERVLNDTWLFNLEDRTWRKFATNSAPSPRLSPGVILDPESRELILFGGLGREQRFGDTWILDLESGSWEEITPPVSPSPRSDMGLALDPTQRIALLFGGYCQEFERAKCAETWEFDLESRTWVEVETADSPPVTYGLRLIFDPHNQRFLQWGGHMTRVSSNAVESLGYGDTLWSLTFSEGKWVTIPQQGSAIPRERYWHHLAFDPISAAIILYGGDGGQGYLDDTWIYESHSNQWRLVRADTPPPPPRINGAIAFDEGRQQMILFGGLGEDFFFYRDTWVYSTATAVWEQILP